MLRPLGLVLVLAGSAAAAPSPYIYLDRCSNGCVVQSGADDARSQTTSLAMGAGPFTIGEFTDDAGEVGAAADAEWAQVVQCMKEVYSPYALTVTDQLAEIPADASYTDAIIAGHASDIGLAGPIFGIAPNASCNAVDDVIAFTFANDLPATARVVNLCVTAAQETALVFGLEREAESCDVMSDQFVCGGERFFLDDYATCSRDCACGATQSSHEKLLALFGAGVSIIPPPTVIIVFPAAGATVGDDAAIQLQAGSQPGITRVELWLNGHNWTSVPGADAGADGQPDPANYTLVFPEGVPDSIIEVVVKAYDEVGAETDSPTLTITKGAPCESDSTCATGQVCTQGECIFTASPPPVAGGGGCSVTGDRAGWLLALLVIGELIRRR